MNEILGPRFEQAIAYACLLHADQRRKGTDIPYLAHLMGVVGLMIEDAAAVGELSEDDAIAAVLHDTAEDRGGEPRLADIEARFGERVARVVRACSDSLEPGADKAPWRERKEAYLAHLATETDHGILRVSLADKVHNARAILADYRRLGDGLWSRFNRDADTPWYYRRLSEIFAERLPGAPLAQELARVVADLDAAIAGNHAGLVVLHADWGKDPKKRWIARARRTADGWAIEALGRWVGESSPLKCLGLAADEPGHILIGVDFPIGLPQAYAEKAEVGHFRDALPLLGREGWEEFYEVAHSAGEISIGRPFYPYAPGQKKQEHLTAALGIPIDQLRRLCEKPTATHGAACPLFWTIGASQVGKGAIAGWQELVAPLVRDAGAALWPFDGDIADLIASHFLTIAETYPAEYYKPLGFGPSGWSKRKQPDRVARAPMILDAAAALSATVAPGVAALVTGGFGEGPEGEDPFDAVVGLLGMLMALRDGAEAPTAESIRTVEGWILGQPPP